MPIDTKIDGDPEGIRGAARWMRGTLSTGIHDCATQIYAARGNSEAEWTGEAGDKFRVKMISGGGKADTLSADADRAGQSMEVFADDLQTALTRMGRAREIAAGGGLTLTATQILDPGPAPAAPGTLPADATPDQAAAHQSAVDAQSAHARQVDAYAKAQTEASAASSVLDFGKQVAQNVWSDLTGKAAFQAADLGTGVAGALAAANASALRGQARALAAHGQTLAQRYVSVGAESRSADIARWLAQRGMGSADDLAGGSTPAALRAMQGERLRISGQMHTTAMATDTAEAAARRAGGVSRVLNPMLAKSTPVLRHVPVVGLAITAAGVGYDIHTGKPAGKAIVSGLAGFGASVAVGAAIGGPVGAVVGIGVGLVASGLADAAYDALPDSITKPFEEGVSAVGNAIGDGAEAVADGAKKVWDSIF